MAKPYIVPTELNELSVEDARHAEALVVSVWWKVRLPDGRTTDFGDTLSINTRNRTPENVAFKVEEFFNAMRTFWVGYSSYAPHFIDLVRDQVLALIKVP
jgi:hypothetical protein